MLDDFIACFSSENTMSRFVGPVSECTTALFSNTNHQYVDRVRCLGPLYNVKINWSHPKRMFDVFGAFVAHASALTFREWMCIVNSAARELSCRLAEAFHSLSFHSLPTASCDYESTYAEGFAAKMFRAQSIF